jgi:hypothetical protein
MAEEVKVCIYLPGHIVDELLRSVLVPVELVFRSVS